MITIKSSGNFNNTDKFFNQCLRGVPNGTLEKYGKAGVEALKAATPKDTGLTAESWTYSIETGKGTTRIVWSNNNRNDGANIAVLLQYGHATGNGGFVQGVDYINPALRSLFEEIADSSWKEVTKT